MKKENKKFNKERTAEEEFECIVPDMVAELQSCWSLWVPVYTGIVFVFKGFASSQADKFLFALNPAGQTEE